MIVNLTTHNAMEFLSKVLDKGKPLGATGHIIGRDLWLSLNSTPDVPMHSMSIVLKENGTWEAICNLPAVGE